MADTTSYRGAYNYDNTGNKQYRFITIVKSTQWTGNHYVSGQSTKSTYLKNGGIIELVYIVLQSVVKPGITGFFKIDLHIKCYIYLS